MNEDVLIKGGAHDLPTTSSSGRWFFHFQVKSLLQPIGEIIIQNESLCIDHRIRTGHETDLNNNILVIRVGREIADAAAYLPFGLPEIGLVISTGGV